MHNHFVGQESTYHSTNCSTNGICFELAIYSACYLVNL